MRTPTLPHVSMMILALLAAPRLPGDESASYHGSGYPDPKETPLGKRRSLKELDFFAKPGPRFMEFRSDSVGQKSWDFFYNTVVQALGHAPKVFAEERPASVPNLEKMRRYGTAHPEKILFCHYNFSGMRADCPEAKLFSPAHWLYLSGTNLAKPATAQTDVTAVADPSRFQVVARVKQKKGAKRPESLKVEKERSFPGEGNDVVAIVPVENGKKVWDKAEFAAVLEINGADLKVQRAVLNTKAATFDKGAYVAPLMLRFGYAGPATFRRYNYSTDCPLDGKGRNCGDVMAQMIHDWFKPGGPLERMHGIMSDVFPWSLGPPNAVVVDNNVETETKAAPGSRLADANADGKPDNGYDERGAPFFSLGVYDTMRKIRLALGPERLFTADGNGPNWIRCPRFQNGMETEGLTWHHDYDYRRWASNLNLFQYWLDYPSPLPYKFNFIVPKVFLPENTPNLERTQYERKRLAWAVAAILDVGVSASGVPEKDDKVRSYRICDEATRGVDNMPQWLGRPVTPLIRPAKTAPDLLKGIGVDMTPPFVSGWKSDTSALSASDGVLRVASKGHKSGQPEDAMKISYAGLRIPEGDLFFRFMVKMDRFRDFPEDVFRYVTGAVDGRKTPPDRHGELYGVGNGKDFTEACFYYQNAGPATVTLNLAFEGEEDVYVKEFTVHNAVDALARGFEHGAAIANPSDRPYTFDLKTLLPGMAFRRIKGHDDDPGGVNTGEPAGPALTLPALSGLFLVREP